MQSDWLPYLISGGSVCRMYTKQVMQYGIPFSLFGRFGKGIKRSYSKSNPRENLNSKKIWYKNMLSISITNG